MKAKGAAGPRRRGQGNSGPIATTARPKTLTYTDYQVNAFNALTKHYAQFLGPDSRPTDCLPISSPIPVISATSPPFLLECVGRGRRPPRARLPYTNNWPAEPRRQWSHRRSHRLVGLVADRPARRHRHHVRGVWPVEPAHRLAFQHPATTGVLQAAWRGQTHFLAAGNGLLLPDHRGALS